MTPQAAALAQEPVYNVEILVFRHLTAPAADSELFTRPAADPVVALPGESVPDPVPDKTPPPPAGTFRPMDRDDFKLLQAYETMRRSRDYSPMLHTGWVQSGWTRRDAVPYPVAGGSANYVVTGTARLVLEQRLRLDFDLEMAGGDGERFVLRDGRPLRRGDLHYFDHPRFGVIAVVTRQ